MRRRRLPFSTGLLGLLLSVLGPWWVLPLTAESSEILRPREARHPAEGIPTVLLGTALYLELTLLFRFRM